MPRASGHVVEERIELLGDSRSEQFELLYNASRSRVYNLAARVVGNPEDAADITQEVFLRAFVNHPNVCDLERPEPWLYKVTMNACYDHLRRRKTRRSTSLEEAGEIVAQGDGFAASEMTQAIESALGGLSVRYRTAILLRDLYGLETGEIGAALGVSSATTRVLLHRARRAFRRSLEHASPGASTAMSGVGLAVLLPDLAVPAGLSSPALSGAIAAGSSPVLVPSALGWLATKIGGLASLKVAAAATAVVVVAGGGAARLHINSLSSDATRLARGVRRDHEPARRPHAARRREGRRGQRVAGASFSRGGVGRGVRAAERDRGRR